MGLALDHVSVRVPAVGAAVAMLRDLLGLITTPTPAVPDRHGRMYLDRGYLEVFTGAEASLPFFFLRYDRLDHTLEALHRRGFQARVTPYKGHDGIWQEIELDAAPAAPLPSLIRRITPVEVARNWPPPLAAPHPCGAEALAAVHLRVPRLGPAVEIYERLLGSPARELGAGGAVVRVGSGWVVLREAAGRSPAIVGIELRVASLEYTQSCLSGLGTRTWRADAALWTELPGGWHLGFREAAADPPSLSM